MQFDGSELFELEQKFWQSMVDEDTDAALGLLCEPAFMVGPHGSMKFDHAGYRQMAEHGAMTIKSYELSDIDATFPTPGMAVLTYRARQVLCRRGESQEHEIVQQMADTSTWIREGDAWRCVMHTETPVVGTH